MSPLVFILTVSFMLTVWNYTRRSVLLMIALNFKRISIASIFGFWQISWNWILRSARSCRCIHIEYPYEIGDKHLTRVNSYSDIGVLLGTKLIFSQHNQTVVKSALKLLGFLIRNTKPFSDSLVLIRFYNVFSRTKLKYCASVWNSNCNLYVHQLKSVQRRLLRTLYYTSSTLISIIHIMSCLMNFNH